MTTLRVALTGCEVRESHFSLRDVYTRTNGDLVLRFEGSHGTAFEDPAVRVSITLTQEELHMVKVGLHDNQKLRPDRGYPTGYVDPVEGRMVFPDGSTANTDPHTGIPLPEGIEK